MDEPYSMATEIASLVAEAKEWYEAADADWRREAELVRRTGWASPSTAWAAMIESAARVIDRARGFDGGSPSPRREVSDHRKIERDEMVVRASDVAGAAAEIHRLRAELARMKGDSLELRARMLDSTAKALPPAFIVRPTPQYVEDCEPGDVVEWTGPVIVAWSDSHVFTETRTEAIVPGHPPQRRPEVGRGPAGGGQLRCAWRLRVGVPPCADPPRAADQVGPQVGGRPQPARRPRSRPGDHPMTEPALPASNHPGLTDDQRFTLDCYERSRSQWVRIAGKVGVGGATTMHAEAAAQIRATRWYKTRGGYTTNAVEALHLVGHVARVAGGSTINGGPSADERITGWLCYLVHLGVMLDEWGLSIGPLIELADRWSQGEENQLNLASSMVDLTVMFAAPVSVRAVPANVADEMRRPAFAALGILTTAVIATARAQVSGPVGSWPDGVTVIGQFIAAVDFVCGSVR
jgi:hypothetical protein